MCFLLFVSMGCVIGGLGHSWHLISTVGVVVCWGMTDASCSAAVDNTCMQDEVTQELAKVLYNSLITQQQQAAKQSPTVD